MKVNPEEFFINRLGKADIQIARKLFLLLQEVFAVENPIVPNEEYLGKLLENPDFICFAAIYGDGPAGGITAYQLPMYHSTTPEIYIYDIAVKPKFQRMGLGESLLNAIKSYATQNGINVVFVQANIEDQHALDFYRAVNTSEEKVVQFTFTG